MSVPDLAHMTMTSPNSTVQGRNEAYFLESLFQSMRALAAHIWKVRQTLPVQPSIVHQLPPRKCKTKVGTKRRRACLTLIVKSEALILTSARKPISQCFRAQASTQTWRTCFCPTWSQVRPLCFQSRHARPSLIRWNQYRTQTWGRRLTTREGCLTTSRPLTTRSACFLLIWTAVDSGHPWASQKRRAAVRAISALKRRLSRSRWEDKTQSCTPKWTSSRLNAPQKTLNRQLKAWYHMLSPLSTRLSCKTSGHRQADCMLLIRHHKKGKRLHS